MSDKSPKPEKPEDVILLQEDEKVVKPKSRKQPEAAVREAVAKGLSGGSYHLVDGNLVPVTPNKEQRGAQ